MPEAYISRYQTGTAVDNALDAGVAANSEVVTARGQAASLNARITANETAISNKANASDVYTKAQVDTSLGNKVDKVSGKGLSTNDYTTTEKNKLAGLSNYDDSQISGRVTAAENDIATLKGNASTSGSVANSVAGGVQTAKDYTDTEIGKLDADSVGGSGKYIKSVSQTDGKITAVEETMDTVPTASSTKALTSGAIYTALGNKANSSALTSETTARTNGDSLLTSVLQTPLSAEPKNFVRFMNPGGTFTKITFQIDKEAGTVTVSTDGASIGYKNLKIMGLQDSANYEDGVPLPRGTYVLKGLPSGASASTYRFILGITTSPSATRTTEYLYSDYEFSVTNDTTRIDLAVYVPASANISTPAVIKPMLIRKDVNSVSPDFVVGGTPILLTSAVASIINGKCKNLLDLSSVSSATTPSGVTWTVDPSAGTVRAQASSVSENTFLYIWTSNTNYLAEEPHILNGCPADGGQSVYNIQAAIGSTVYRDTGKGIEVPAGIYRYVAIGVYSGQTNVDLTFRPMLIPVSAYKISRDFTPYHPPLSEMWAAIRALQS